MMLLFLYIVFVLAASVVYHRTWERRDFEWNRLAVVVLMIINYIVGSHIGL